MGVTFHTRAAVSVSTPSTSSLVASEVKALKILEATVANSILERTAAVIILFGSNGTPDSDTLWYGIEKMLQERGKRGEHFIDCGGRNAIELTTLYPHHKRLWCPNCKLQDSA